MLSVLKNIIESFKAQKSKTWVQGLFGSSRVYFIAEVLKKTGRASLTVTYAQDSAELLFHELKTFLPNKEILLLPPCDIPVPASEIQNLRRAADTMTVLSSFLTTQKSPACIISIQALLRKITSPAELKQAAIKIRKGESVNIKSLLKKLQEYGYDRTGEVCGPGEFSTRGGILDVFPIQAKFPLRIELDEETAGSLRRFNPETQRSFCKIPEEHIFPVKHISNGKLTSFLSYLPPETAVFIDEPPLIREKAVEINSDFFSFAEIMSELKNYNTVYLSVLPQEIPGMQPAEIHKFSTSPTDSRSCKTALLADKIGIWLKNGYTIVIYCNNDGEKSRLTELLADYSIKPGRRLALNIGMLRSGFVFHDMMLVVLSDEEIFGRYQNRSPTRHRRGIPLTHESELDKGDYVVHINHGIGRYLGLEKLETDGKAGEFLAIEYLGGDKLYIPPSHIHLVEKYSGIEGNNPPLYRLGGSSWNLAKQRAKRAIRDMASELLELYATRQVKGGFAFSADTNWQREFESSFIYKETPDQLLTIKEVKADMENAKPMDRLLCGDSGYGKTEIAVRAAFKTAMDGKQTAVLVPTTLLSEQHYVTFSERMADYPVIVAALSRFKTRTEQEKIIAGMKKGSVDIIIGTHRLLQNDISFHDLGLVIVDEEQRFGVAQKEKLKHLRKTVDVLTMTATPIPRTLYMSLMGARDISFINTPPENRIPVEGHLAPFSSELVRNSILREIERGGQVFYLHNRIGSIQAVREMIENLVPETRVRTAHGQMPERKLEKVMLDFLASRIDVLVCTTIIESGLDIPNVNTIIIDRADTYGLADLYQLRGRVGRYKQRAHAFFLVEGIKPVTSEAKKRLKAIDQLTEQSAGFHLAMRDLEIRGAGNLLGAQQHGHIVAIGFDLYCKLLRQTVGELRGEKIEDFQPAIDLHIEPIIQESLITESRNRVMIYRKMADIVDFKGIEELREELLDRFGIPPGSIAQLLGFLRLKVKAKKYGVAYIGLNENMLHIRYRNGNSFVHNLQPVCKDSELLHKVENLIEKDFSRVS